MGCACAGRLRHRQEHQQPLHGQEPVQEDPSAPLERWTRLVRTLRRIARLRRIWANLGYHLQGVKHQERHGRALAAA